MSSRIWPPVAGTRRVAESELVVAVCRTAAILIAIVSPGYVRGGVPPSPFEHVAVITAAVYNAALLILYWRNIRFRGMRAAAVATDVAFVTIWVYLAIPAGASIFGLYYLLVVVAALWFGVIGTTATAAGSAGLYMLALHAGGASPAALDQALTQQIPVLVLAAVVAGYMADAQRRERESWDRDRGVLTEFENRRKIIQEFYDRLAPQRLAAAEGLDVGLRFRPALQMGAGDYYDLLTVTPGRYLAVVADVGGKYAGSLMQVPFLKFSLLAAARSGQSAAGILTQVNNNMFPQAEEDADRIVSLCCLLIDVQAGSVTYASAGHDPPLLVRGGSKEIITLQRGDLVMGVQPGVAYQQETVSLEPGDTLVLYTDGVTEATNAGGQQFGLEGVQAAVRAGVGLEMEADALAHQVFLTVRDFARGGHRDDDMTLMVLRFRPPVEAAG